METRPTGYIASYVNIGKAPLRVRVSDPDARL
jgi:hypothetical protein